MKKLRVAIIGFGFMGKTHAVNIINGNQMELLAIVDPEIDDFVRSSGNLDTGNISPEHFEKVNKYKNIEDCFSNEQLDVVFVCVHTLLHYEVVMKSLKRGVHVFVEKPFVFKEEEGQILIAEANKRNLKLMVGHVVRFMPAYTKLYELYNKKTFGRLKFLSMTRFAGIPDWGNWNELREDFGSSGGALFDLVIHDIDFLQHMLGTPEHIDSLCIPGRLSKHDYISATWHYGNNDANIRVEGGQIFHSKFPFEAGFKAMFEKASVAWSSKEGGEMQITTDNTVQTIALDPIEEGYAIEAGIFAESIMNDSALTVTAQSAINTIKLCYKHI